MLCPTWARPLQPKQVHCWARPGPDRYSQSRYTVGAGLGLTTTARSCTLLGLTATALTATARAGTLLGPAWA